MTDEINEVISLLDHYHRKVMDYGRLGPEDRELFTRVDKKTGKQFVDFGEARLSQIIKLELLSSECRNAYIKHKWKLADNMPEPEDINWTAQVVWFQKKGLLCKNIRRIIDALKVAKIKEEHTKPKTPYNPEEFYEKVKEIVTSLQKTPAPQAGQGEGKDTETPAEKSVETTLFYNSSTGKFSFNGVESLTISKEPKARVRGIAEKLMPCWEKGKPCPQSKIVAAPSKNTPQGVYNDISAVRKTLKSIKVNMPQCTKEGYPPPVEPKHFTRTR